MTVKLHIYNREVGQGVSNLTKKCICRSDTQSYKYSQLYMSLVKFFSNKRKLLSIAAIHKSYIDTQEF